MGLFSRKKDESIVDEGKPYEDRSTVKLTATRGDRDPRQIDWRVYHSHEAMLWMWPGNARRGNLIAPGLDVDDAYCKLFAKAVEQGYAFALTVEDDMIVPPDLVSSLFAAFDERPELAAVSALYHTREEPSRPLILGYPEVENDSTFRPEPETQGLVEVNAIPMGAALWRLSTLEDVPKPWFITTENQTQDGYFCLNARARGFRFAVDTRVRCGHFDRDTKRIF